jgi:hypothetical protein
MGVAVAADQHERDPEADLDEHGREGQRAGESRASSSHGEEEQDEGERGHGVGEHAVGNLKLGVPSAGGEAAVAGRPLPSAGVTRLRRDDRGADGDESETSEHARRGKTGEARCRRRLRSSPGCGRGEDERGEEEQPDDEVEGDQPARQREPDGDRAEQRLEGDEDYRKRCRPEDVGARAVASPRPRSPPRPKARLRAQPRRGGCTRSRTPADQAGSPSTCRAASAGSRDRRRSREQRRRLRPAPRPRTPRASPAGESGDRACDAFNRPRPNPAGGGESLVPAPARAHVRRHPRSSSARPATQT